MHQPKIIKKQKRPQKLTRERYQNLSEEEKNKKRQYGHERYKNLPEDENQKLDLNRAQKNTNAS